MASAEDINKIDKAKKIVSNWKNIFMQGVVEDLINFDFLSDMSFGAKEFVDNVGGRIQYINLIEGTLEAYGEKMKAEFYEEK